MSVILRISPCERVERVLHTQPWATCAHLAIGPQLCWHNDSKASELPPWPMPRHHDRRFMLGDFEAPNRRYGWEALMASCPTHKPLSFNAWMPRPPQL